MKNKKWLWLLFIISYPILVWGQSETDNTNKRERKGVFTQMVKTNTMDNSWQTREVSVELKNISSDEKSFHIEITIKNNSEQSIELIRANLDLKQKPAKSEENSPGGRLGYWAPNVISSWTLVGPGVTNRQTILMAPNEVVTARLDILKLKWGLGMAGGYPAEKFGDVVKSGKYDLTLRIIGKFPDQEKENEFASRSAGIEVNVSSERIPK